MTTVRRGLGWAFLLAAMAPAAVSGQDQRIAVAVLPFENGGSYGKERDEFDGLRKGLAALLISELGTNPGLRTVDRVETQRILDQQGPNVADRVDRATAAKVGAQAGATHVVMGSFIDLYGDFRVDARLVAVDGGGIVKAVHNDPALHDRRDLYRMILSVVERLSGAPLPAFAPARRRHLTAEAITHFGRALLYQDRGDRSRALEFYQKALAASADFTEAGEGLRRLGTGGPLDEAVQPAADPEPHRAVHRQEQGDHFQVVLPEPRQHLEHQP